MGLVIGMDEAGYGPNLGPLVVCTSVWEVPDHPRETDFWSAFDGSVSQQPTKADPRLHIADSKEVYSPSRGLANLERSVLCTLRLLGERPATFRELLGSLLTSESPSETDEPWFRDGDLELPTATTVVSLDEPAAAFAQSCDQSDIRLLTIRCDVVDPQRFNRITAEFDSKSIALSRISLNLLADVWDPNDDRPTLIVCDKHGARNRYDHLLCDVTGGAMVFRLDERKECSRYKVGTTEIRFQMKAEQHFPVAVASMAAKYIRELSMELFNQFWSREVSDLKPTKGYPVDARRFKADIAEAQQRLGIPEDVLWRAR